MAFSTRAIRSKIGAVKNIRKITRAMELVSASKMRQATQNALSTREYSAEALNVLMNIAGEQHIEHQLLEPGKGKKTLMIVTASNKGLCGGFNVAIGRAVSDYIKDHPDEEIDFVTIGKRAERLVKKLERLVIGSFVEFSDDLKAHEIIGLSKIVLDSFGSGEYRKVRIVYANYVSAIQYQPIMREILPVNPDIIQNIIDEISKDDAKTFKKESLALYLFEPDEEEVLDLILPRLVESIMYQALLESLASEHSARMLAMKNASDNARNVLDDLTLSYNYARQAAVTQEISEISAGANAMGI